MVQSQRYWDVTISYPKLRYCVFEFINKKITKTFLPNILGTDSNSDSYKYTFEIKLMCLNLTISVYIWHSERYVLCNCVDRKKQNKIHF